MDILATIAKELNIKETQVENAVKLIDEGNTIPFIARYRKEAHGSLTDTQLRDLSDRLTYLRNLEEAKEKAFTAIEAQQINKNQLDNINNYNYYSFCCVSDFHHPILQKQTLISQKQRKGLRATVKN